MLMVVRRLHEARRPDDSLVLPFDLRSRSRFRARLAGGTEVGVVLPRGQVLRGGDLLLAEDGRVIEVRAALEVVTSLRSDEPSLLARAAFHLGNRHVALEIGEGWLRYLHDHVLDAMAHGMGLAVTVESAPFEPEAGAYHEHADGHTHAHGHAHTHAHGDAHEHAHSDRHTADHHGAPQSHTHPHTRARDA